MKLNIKTFFAMLAMALFTINAQAQFANEPTANYKLNESSASSARLVSTPSVQQPNAQVQTYQSTGKTHGSVSVSNGQYRVSTPAMSAGRTARPVLKSPAARSGILSGASSIGGSSSIGKVPTDPRQDNVVPGFPGFIGQEEGNDDVTPGDYYAGGVVPIGNAVLPLMALLLCYALFLAGRAYVRKNKEENA